MTIGHAIALPVASGSDAEGVAALTRLVERCQAGDVEAQRELYRVYSPRVLRWAQRLAPRHTDPQDVTQDVFLAIFTGKGGYRGEAPFEGWLYRIVRNTAFKPPTLMARLTRLVGATPRDVPSPHPPEDRDALLEARVREALERLPRKQREALVLYDIEERPAPEVASMLRVPVGTVRSRVRLARANLQRLLPPGLLENL